MYGFYWKNHDIVADGGNGGMMDGLARAAAGWWASSCTVLTNQMLFPEHWMAWYAPGDVVDPRRHSLHYWHLPRFCSSSRFLRRSPVPGSTAAPLPAGREGSRCRLPRLAARPGAEPLMLVGGVVAVLMGALWMATLPEKMAWFASSIWMLMAVVLLAAVVALPLVLRGRIDRLLGLRHFRSARWA
jgi:hypothetical protein